MSTDLVLPDGERSTAAIAIAAAFLVLLMLVTIIGNVIVIIAATTYHNLKEQVSNMFIVNLAVTDLSVALLVMLYSLIVLTIDVKVIEGDKVYISNVSITVYLVKPRNCGVEKRKSLSHFTSLVLTDL